MCVQVGCPELAIRYAHRILTGAGSDAMPPVERTQLADVLLHCYIVARFTQSGGASGGASGDGVSGGGEQRRGSLSSHEDDCIAFLQVRRGEWGWRVCANHGPADACLLCSRAGLPAQQSNKDYTFERAIELLVSVAMVYEAAIVGCYRDCMRSALTKLHHAGSDALVDDQVLQLLCDRYPMCLLCHAQWKMGRHALMRRVCASQRLCTPCI